MPESKVRQSANNRKGSRSKSISQGSDVKHAVSRRLATEDTPPQRRWLLPAMVILAALGVLWGALYFVNSEFVPYMDHLGGLNIVIGAAAVVLAAILFLALRPKTGIPGGPGSRRWVPPAFITVGLLGVVWLILFYVAGQDLAFMTLLGNWNILIGMAGMAGAFIIATLWK